MQNQSRSGPTNPTSITVRSKRNKSGTYDISRHQLWKTLYGKWFWKCDATVVRSSGTTSLFQPRTAQSRSKNCRRKRRKRSSTHGDLWMVIPAGAHQVSEYAGIISKHCTPLPYTFQSFTAAVYTLLLDNYLASSIELSFGFFSENHPADQCGCCICGADSCHLAPVCMEPPSNKPPFTTNNNQ